MGWLHIDSRSSSVGHNGGNESSLAQASRQSRAEGQSLSIGRGSNNSASNIQLITGNKNVAEHFNGVGTSSSSLGKRRGDGDSGVAGNAGGLVDLHQIDDISNNNLSDNDGSSLVKEVPWGQDVTSNSGSSDVDDSVRAQNVVDEATSDGGEGTTEEVNSSRTTNVDHPRSLEVAVVEGIVGDGVEDGVGDGDTVSGRGLAVTVEEETTILNRLENIVRSSGKGVGELAVALSSTIEIAVKSSGSTSDSLLEVLRSSESSTNVDSFSISWEVVVGSIGIDTTRGEGEISRDNKSKWQISIRSIEGVQFATNGETRNVGVVSNSNSSLDITTKIVQITERNQVEVSERRDLGSNGEKESSAGSLKVGAENIGRRRSWWGWVNGAVESVDLVGLGNGSDNHISNNGSRGLVQSRTNGQDASFGLEGRSNGSSGTREIVKEVLWGNESLLGVSESSITTSNG